MPTELSTQLIRKLESVDPAMTDRLLAFADEMEEKTKIITVGRNDFNDLKAVVKRIADAQERTEQKIGSLTSAQEKTERRLEALTRAQEKTERRLETIAIAQQKMEGSLEALTISHQRLAEAQERTERSLNDLIKDHKSVKKQLGGLSMDVGHGIKDRMIPHLPAFVKKEFGVALTRVDRRNVILLGNMTRSIRMAKVPGTGRISLSSERPGHNPGRRISTISARSWTDCKGY